METVTIDDVDALNSAIDETKESISDVPESSTELSESEQIDKVNKANEVGKIEESINSGTESENDAIRDGLVLEKDVQRLFGLV